jgi:hypothetical protein
MQHTFRASDDTEYYYYYYTTTTAATTTTTTTIIITITTTTTTTTTTDDSNNSNSSRAVVVVVVVVVALVFSIISGWKQAIEVLTTITVIVTRLHQHKQELLTTVRITTFTIITQRSQHIIGLLFYNNTF